MYFPDCGSFWLMTVQGIPPRDLSLGQFHSVINPSGKNPPLVTNSVNVCSSWLLIKEFLPWRHGHICRFFPEMGIVWAWRQALLWDYLHSKFLLKFLFPLRDVCLKSLLVWNHFFQEKKSRAWQTMRDFVCWLIHWLKDFHYSLLCDSENNFFVLSNCLSIKLESLQW